MSAARKTVDLSTSRVLLSNDDGIHADGLAALTRAVAPLVGEIRTVAPERGRSGASHMISYADAISLRRAGPGHRYMTDGTPADAAIFGLQQVFADGLPDLVLSGVNHGLNLGDDLFSSGTVGVAVEACLQHVPAVALSAYKGQDGMNWDTAERAIPDVLKRIAAFGWPRDVFYNVNIPNLPYSDLRGMLAVPQGRMDHAASFVLRGDEDPRRGSVHRLKHNGGTGVRDGVSDYRAMRDGYVTVTPVRVEITDWAVLDELKEVFA